MKLNYKVTLNDREVMLWHVNKINLPTEIRYNYDFYGEADELIATYHEADVICIELTGGDNYESEDN